MRTVLDASALLALLHREPGWEKVHSVIEGSGICTINWCEAIQKIGAKGLDTGGLRASLEELGLFIIPFSVEHAELAASLWKSTRQQGLSLADRACLAVAIGNKAPVYTADKAWTNLGLDLDIQLLR